ncbi:uncharacterized protein LOC125757052 [Rhipicephalus sanguineus]|uniref:uncharacterized protein LOC125757052 n=1 Tax=Rhipicephalus sanguineus TaxID=34632 RepID=UPI0020C2FEC1|nr:uncharacterized protein LOC125757052 [Rhipicephalus sanguineus]
MPKTSFVHLQVMLWLSASTSPYCFQSAPDLPHGRPSRTGICLPMNAHSLRMTSSAADLLKDQRDNKFFRGHGTHLMVNMPKTSFVHLQVGYFGNVFCYRSDDRFLLLVPCPGRCFIILWHCCTTISLLLSGDIEQNPGPTNAQMLQAILGNQTASDRKIDTIKDEINELNTRTEKLSGYLAVIQEINKRIQNLEHIVQEQAEKLADYENRSRRNNLLVFGVPESKGASVFDLKKVVIDKLFKETLGVEVQTVERIHRIGKEKPGKDRPIIMKFYDYREKESVLQNCKKLKGTAITISHDYARETVEIRRKLWKSAASDRANGAQVKLVHDKIKINGVLYGWHVTRDERYLCGNRKDTRKQRNAHEAADTVTRSEQEENTSSKALGTPFSSPQA